jgi:hypothetical protein
VEVFERKVLRSVHGPEQDNGACRSRCNNELNTLFKEPKRTTVVEVVRLRWAGRVERFDEDQMPKRLLNENPSGRRHVGRRRSGWMGENARKMGIRRWWSRALDREEWKTLVEEAETLNQL